MTWPKALVAAVESLESRVDRYMGEVGSRLDALQELRVRRHPPKVDLPVPALTPIPECELQAFSKLS